MDKKAEVMIQDELSNRVSKITSQAKASMWKIQNLHQDLENLSKHHKNSQKEIQCFISRELDKLEAKTRALY